MSEIDKVVKSSRKYAKVLYKDEWSEAQAIVIEALCSIIEDLQSKLAKQGDNNE